MSINTKKIWEKIPKKIQIEILNSLTKICMEISYEQEYAHHQSSPQQKSDDLHPSVNNAPSLNP